MNNEQNNNSNNLNPSNDLETLSEKGNKEEILELARQQKAKADKERIERDKKEHEQAKKELQLLTENSDLRKQMSDIKKQVEALKYKAVLERELDTNSRHDQGEMKPKELTADQRVHQILAEVVRERKIEAQEARKKKNDNVFYI